MMTDKWSQNCIKENRKRIWLWFFCGMATALAYTLVPLLLSWVIDGLEKEKIVASVCAFLMVRFFAQAGGAVTDYLRKEAQHALVNSGRKALYRFLWERKPTAVLGWPSGKLLNVFRMMDDYMTDCMLPAATIMTAGLGTLLAAILLFLESPLFLLSSLLAIVFWYSVTERLNRKVMKKEMQTQKARSTLYEAVAYLFDHLEAVATSRRSELTLREYERKQAELKTAHRSLEAVTATRDELINRAFLESFRVGLILFSILWRGNVYVGQALLCYYLVENLYISVIEVGMVRNKMLELKVKKKFLREVWNIEGQSTSNTAFDPMQNPLIRAEHISLKAGKQQILKDFSCQIHRGMTTLIYGKTGQGKTTLVRCLLGLCQPDSGKIYNGETCFEEITTDEILKNFAVFMQNGKLFTMSLRDNLFLSAGVENWEEADFLVRKLKLDKLLERNGNSEEWEEDSPEGRSVGNKLSGGEIQRCRIARTLLSGKEIYVFDEPTSQLDEENEEKVCQLIGGLKERGCTVLLISHRESVMKLADTVINLDETKKYNTCYKGEPL